MKCEVCNGDLLPQKDVVCPSGTDLCAAPVWYCPECYNVLYVRSQEEFDYWIEQFLFIENNETGQYM